MIAQDMAADSSVDPRFSVEGPRLQDGLAAALGWAVLGISAAVVLPRVSAVPQWRADRAVVGALGFLPVSGEGPLSQVLTQLLALLPLGGRLLRSGLVSAVGLVIATRLVYGLGGGLLARNARSPVLGPMLAALAALTATSCPSWQIEGTIAGGATVAAALALGCFSLAQGAKVGDVRPYCGLGALVTLTWFENRAAGLAAVSATGMGLLLAGHPVSRRCLHWAIGGSLPVLLIGALPLLLRSQGWVGVSPSELAADQAWEPVRVRAWHAWVEELGFVPLLAAASGVAWGLSRGRTRAMMGALVIWVAADAAIPAGSTPWAPGPLVPLRLLATAALLVAVALAVQTVAIAIPRSGIPLARTARVLVVVLFSTLVFVTGESSRYDVARHEAEATEVYTEEALRGLPPRAVVLLSHGPILWRLWGTTVLRGDRPDLLVIPLAGLSRAALARELLAAEPQLAGALRDVAIAGRLSELSLSTLADARPLFVEVDPSWDRRLLDHLVPGTLWTEFSAHALGHSDRRQAEARRLNGVERVLTAAIRDRALDPGTLTILGVRSREQALLLGELGDREGLQQVISLLKRLDASAPLAAELEQRLAASRRGAVDVRALPAWGAPPQ